MASIAELVKIVAEVEGLEENYVSVYARAAREAGFIAHHGRGRNAAKMSVRDAVNLLIAVNGSDLAKNVPAAIVDYRGLETISAIVRHNVSQPSLRRVLKLPNFGEVLEGLLELCVPDEEGQTHLSSAIVNSIGFPQGGVSKQDLIDTIDDHVRMEVVLSRPNHFAAISFKDKSRREYGGAAFSSGKRGNTADRVISTTISQTTLRRVGAVLIP